MISFNDFVYSGAEFHGATHVTAISPDGKREAVYDGDGEYIPNYEPWGEGWISHIYYDSINDCIQIDVEEEE